MKKILVITFSIIMITLNLFAQTVSTSTNNGKSSIDKMGIDWNIFANHPMRELMESSLPLTKDLYTILSANDNVEFLEKYLKNPNSIVEFLVRYNPLSTYMSAFRNTKDEFERNKVEKQILNDYDNLLRKKYDNFFTCIKMRLSEYSFTHKGFAFRYDQAQDFRSFHRQMHIVDDVEFASFPMFLSMDEDVAKQFIRDNPSREVMVYGLVKNFNSYGESIDIQQYSKLEFIAITSVPKNAREKVIAIYPNVESLSQRLEQLEIEASGEKSEMQFSTIYDGSYAITRSELNMIYDKLENSSRNRFVDLYNKCENYGFVSNLTVYGQNAVERNKQFVENQKRKYNGFPKIGVPYKGYQLYPGGLKKSIVIVFTKKDDYAYWGKCTYSNGKKSIVEVKVDADRVLPEIKIQFYIPTDDELGAGEGYSFTLSKDGQLIGFEMNDKVNYNSYSKTYISIK